MNLEFCKKEDEEIVRRKRTTIVDRKRGRRYTQELNAPLFHIDWENRQGQVYNLSLLGG